MPYTHDPGWNEWVWTAVVAFWFVSMLALTILDRVFQGIVARAGAGHPVVVRGVVAGVVTVVALIGAAGMPPLMFQHLPHGLGAWWVYPVELAFIVVLGVQGLRSRRAPDRAWWHPAVPWGVAFMMLIALISGALRFSVDW